MEGFGFANQDWKLGGSISADGRALEAQFEPLKTPRRTRKRGCEPIKHWYCNVQYQVPEFTNIICYYVNILYDVEVGVFIGRYTTCTCRIQISLFINLRSHYRR
jgi:hypothetical protein